MNWMLLALLWSFSLVSVISGQDESLQEALVTIKGSVLNPEHARIPNVKVFFNSKERAFTTISDPDGEYSISLPQGVYEVTTERHGWYPVRRGRVAVGTRGAISLTLFPPPKLSVLSIFSMGGAGAGSASEADIQRPRYFEFAIDGDEPEINGVVQYYSQRTKRNSRIFKAAMFSYDAITIAARTLEVIDNRCIEAKGKVFFETANSRWTGNRLKGCFVEKQFRTLTKDN